MTKNTKISTATAAAAAAGSNASTAAASNKAKPASPTAASSKSANANSSDNKPVASTVKPAAERNQPRAAELTTSWAAVAAHTPSSKSHDGKPTLAPAEQFDENLLQRWEMSHADENAVRVIASNKASAPAIKATGAAKAAVASSKKQAQSPQQKVSTHWVKPAGADQAANEWMMSLSQYECTPQKSRKPSLLSLRHVLAPKTSFQELIQALSRYPFSPHGPLDRSRILPKMPRGPRAIAEFMRGLAHYPCLRHRHRQPRLPRADHIEIARFMYGLINYPCTKTRARYMNSLAKSDRTNGNVYLLWLQSFAEVPVTPSRARVINAMQKPLVAVKRSGKAAAKKGTAKAAAKSSPISPQTAALYVSAVAKDNQRLFARYDVPQHRLPISPKPAAAAASAKGQSTAKQNDLKSLETLFKMYSAAHPGDPTSTLVAKKPSTRFVKTRQQMRREQRSFLAPDLESLFAKTMAGEKASAHKTMLNSPSSGRSTHKHSKTGLVGLLAPDLESLFAMHVREQPKFRPSTLVVSAPAAVVKTTGSKKHHSAQMALVQRPTMVITRRTDSGTEKYYLGIWDLMSRLSAMLGGSPTKVQMASRGTKKAAPVTPSVNLRALLELLQSIVPSTGAGNKSRGKSSAAQSESSSLRAAQQQIKDLQAQIDALRQELHSQHQRSHGTASASLAASSPLNVNAMPYLPMSSTTVGGYSSLGIPSPHMQPQYYYQAASTYATPFASPMLSGTAAAATSAALASSYIPRFTGATATVPPAPSASSYSTGAGMSRYAETLRRLTAALNEPLSHSQH